MEEFNTKEKVEELFESVNGLGENNCIFLCFIDTNREGLKYGALGALGGVVGGAIAGAVAFSSAQTKDMLKNKSTIKRNEKYFRIIKPPV